MGGHSEGFNERNKGRNIPYNGDNVFPFRDDVPCGDDMRPYKSNWRLATLKGSGGGAP